MGLIDFISFQLTPLYVMMKHLQTRYLDLADQNNMIFRDHTSITLSVLEPSQTPTPLCYQGVIFGHTPPPHRLDYVILG